LRPKKSQRVTNPQVTQQIVKEHAVVQGLWREYTQVASTIIAILESLATLIFGHPPKEFHHDFA
jgi:hypothetical protein